MQLDMVSSSVGWGISTNAVVRTTDGGAEWTRVLTLPKAAGMNWFSFRLAALNSSQAWLAEERAIRVRGDATASRGGSQSARLTIRATTNGGVTWSRATPWLPRSVQSSVNSLQFVNSKVGWLMVVQTGMGAPGHNALSHELLGTTDGGLTWSRIEFNYGNRHSPHAISDCAFEAHVTFTSQSDGWATSVSEGCRPPTHSVYRTTDGGSTWLVRDLPVKRGWNPSVCRCRSYLYSQPPTFSGKVGVLPAIVSPPGEVVLYRTSNGGNSWQPTTPIRARRGGVVPEPGFASLGAQRVWMLLDSTLYSTTTYGERWRIAARRPNLDTTAMLQFVSKAEGFALSSLHPAYIYATVDAGHTWRKVRTFMNNM